MAAKRLYLFIIAQIAQKVKMRYNILMLDKLKTQFRRICYFCRKHIFTQANILQVIVLALCIIWAYGAVNAMARNWQLQEKLESRQLEAAKLEIEVETLKLEQEYYQTDEYKELMARTKAGKMLPGETMVILPKNSDAAIQKYAESTEQTSTYQSNFSQWLDFLFG